MFFRTINDEKYVRLGEARAHKDKNCTKSFKKGKKNNVAIITNNEYPHS